MNSHRAPALPWDRSPALCRFRKKIRSGALIFLCLLATFTDVRAGVIRFVYLDYPLVDAFSSDGSFTDWYYLKGSIRWSVVAGMIHPETAPDLGGVYQRFIYQGYPDPGFLFSSRELISPQAFFYHFIDTSRWVHQRRIYFSWPTLRNMLRKPSLREKIYEIRQEIMVPIHEGFQPMFREDDYVSLDTYLTGMNLAERSMEREISLQGGASMFLVNSEDMKISRIILGYLRNVMHRYQQPEGERVKFVWEILPPLFQRSIPLVAEDAQDIDAQEMDHFRAQADARLIQAVIQGFRRHGSPIPRPGAPHAASLAPLAPPTVSPNGLMQWQSVMPSQGPRRRPATCPYQASLWGWWDCSWP